jgi:hypothetical protein
MCWAIFWAIFSKTHLVTLTRPQVAPGLSKTEVWMRHSELSSNLSDMCAICQNKVNTRSLVDVIQRAFKPDVSSRHENPFSLDAKSFIEIGHSVFFNPTNVSIYIHCQHTYKICMHLPTIWAYISSYSKHQMTWKVPSALWMLLLLYLNTAAAPSKRKSWQYNMYAYMYEP